MPVEFQSRRTILSGMWLAPIGLLVFMQNEAQEKEAAEERLAKFKEKKELLKRKEKLKGTRRLAPTLLDTAARLP